MLKTPILKITLLSIAMISASIAFAEEGAAQASSSSATYYVLIAAGIVAVWAAGMMAYAVKFMAKEIHKQMLIQKGEWVEPAESAPTVWEKMEQSLTQVVPIEQEESILFEHEYDGIQELDNRLPPWWVAMFWGAIVFGIVYLFNYHVFGNGKSSIDEYNKEMEIATIKKEKYLEKMANMVNESNVVALTDAASIGNGKKLWIQNCKVCHAEDGGGGVGPNMTDRYWLHGGDVKDIFSTIKYGVPTKGMISWQAQLRPKEMQDLASFILTLQGTTPMKPKKPQGELYDPGDAAPPPVPEDSTAAVPADPVPEVN